jgi:hypothetical protein
MKYLNKILVIMVCMLIADCLRTREESAFKIKISSPGEPEVILLLNIFYSEEVNYELKLTGDETNIIKVNGNGLTVKDNNTLEIPFVLIQNLYLNNEIIKITLYNGVNLIIEKKKDNCGEFNNLKKYLKKSYFMSKTRYIICQIYNNFHTNEKSHPGPNSVEFQQGNKVIDNFKEDLKEFLITTRLGELGLPYSEYMNYVVGPRSNFLKLKADTTPLLDCNKFEELTIYLNGWVGKFSLESTKKTAQRSSNTRLQHPIRSPLQDMVDFDKFNNFPKLPETPKRPLNSNFVTYWEDLNGLIKEIEEVKPNPSQNNLSSSQKKTKHNRFKK